MAKLKVRYYENVIIFFLFVFLTPLVTLSLLGRYEPFEIYSNNVVFLLSCLIMAAILTPVFYFIYKKKGQELVTFRQWKTPAGKVLQILLGVFVWVAGGIATVARFGSLTIGEPVLWISAAVCAVVAAGIYLAAGKPFKPKAA